MRKPSNAEWMHFGRSPEGLGHDSASRRYRLLACRGGHATRALPCEIEIMAKVAAIQASMNMPNERRQWMLEAIRNEARLCAAHTGRPELSERVMEAMAAIPRHRFLPRSMRAAAYDNAALPAGCGQTISQPFIVALMTDLLDLRGDERVLEVGTGTGYQTAVLTRLAGEVFTIERIPELAARAQRVLAELGLDEHVHFRVGDGCMGWPEEAPFDAIIVTAAPERVPPELAGQLAEGGRLVIPVGPAGGVQQLYRMEKRPDGRLDSRAVLPVAFVPLVCGQ